MKRINLKMLVSTVVVFVLIFAVTAIPSLAEEQSVYVSAINASVTAGSGTVFTKDFNGTDTVAQSEGNFRWVTFFTAKPTSESGVFEVVLTGANLENPTDTIKIPENGFIYTAHFEDREGEPLNAPSDANIKVAAAVAVGDKISLSGVDLTAGTITTGDDVTKGAKLILGSVPSGGDVSNDESQTESEDPDASSEPADSSEPDTSSDAASDTSSKTDSSAPATSEEPVANAGLGTIEWVAIIAGAVILIAVISYVIVKRKK